MTKARDIADFKFENIVDTGTEGTKVATGTTAQRGSTAGQLRFNSETALAEYYDGSTFKAIDIAPTVSSIDVTEVDSQAGGNQTIVITGTGFSSGAIVTFVGASATDFNASTVTVDSDTQITAVAPKVSFLNAQEPYGVKVTNVSGLSGTLASQINVDTSPSWQTASGSIGNVGEGLNANLSVSATDADNDTITYSEIGGTVLSTNGFSLNSSTGAITGTAPTVSADTTLSFNLRATANSKTVDRAFSFVVKDAYELPSAYQSFINGRTSGTVYYVSSSQGSDSNNGTSKSTPFQTLAKCADTVSSNDTVVLAPETFTLTGNHYGMEHGYSCISAYKGTGNSLVSSAKTNVWFVGYPQKTKVIVKDVGSALRDAPFTLLSQDSGVIGMIMERELFGGNESFPEPYSMAIFKSNYQYIGGTGSSNAPNVLNCVLKNASQSPTLSGDTTDLGKNIFSWQYDNPANAYFKLGHSTIHNANGSWQNSYSGAGSSVAINNILLSGTYNNDGQVSLTSVESGQSLNTTNWHRASQSATVVDTNGRGVYSGTYSWQNASYPTSTFTGNW
jgi:hypothetical protein